MGQGDLVGNVTTWFHDRIKITKDNSKKVTRARFLANVTAYHAMSEGNKMEMGKRTAKIKNLGTDVLLIISSLE